jgi:hypothetical protein
MTICIIDRSLRFGPKVALLSDGIGIRIRVTTASCQYNWAKKCGQRIGVPYLNDILINYTEKYIT